MGCFGGGGLCCLGFLSWELVLFGLFELGFRGL